MVDFAWNKCISKSDQWNIPFRELNLLRDITTYGDSARVGKFTTSESKRIVNNIVLWTE